MARDLPVSHPGDNEFKDQLSTHFNEGEMDAIDTVIRGYKEQDRDTTFQGINTYTPKVGEAEISLSRELLEVLSIVAKTGKRVLRCVIDGEFMEVRVEILGIKKGDPEKIKQNVRRQVVFTVTRDSSMRARWTGGSLRSKGKTETEGLSLNRESAHAFNQDGEQKMAEVGRLRADLIRQRTDKGHPKYGQNSKRPIYDYLVKFRKEYLAAARANKLIAA